MAESGLSIVVRSEPEGQSASSIRAKLAIGFGAALLIIILFFTYTVYRTTKEVREVPSDKSLQFVSIADGKTIDNYLTEYNLYQLRKVYREQQMPENIRHRIYGNIACLRYLSSRQIQELESLPETEVMSYASTYYVFTNHPAEAKLAIQQ